MAGTSFVRELGKHVGVHPFEVSPLERRPVGVSQRFAGQERKQYVLVVGDAEARCRVGMNLETIAPDGFVDGVGKLLQPRDVRMAPVEELRRRIGVGDVGATEEVAVKAELPSNVEASRLYAEGLEKLR